MVKINRVYTGGSDKVFARRRLTPKSDPRFTVVGASDEANSWLGVILAKSIVCKPRRWGERTNVARADGAPKPLFAYKTNSLTSRLDGLPPKRCPITWCCFLKAKRMC